MRLQPGGTWLETARPRGRDSRVVCAVGGLLTVHVPAVSHATSCGRQCAILHEVLTMNGSVTCCRGDGDNDDNDGRRPRRWDPSEVPGGVRIDAVSLPP